MNKYIYVSILLSLLFVFSCQKKTDKAHNFTIKGVLENIESPYFFLAHENADSMKVDTVFVDKNGYFSYSGEISDLTMASLFFNQKSWSISIFLNKGWNVDIKGDINRPDLVMVNGGSVNDDLTSFKKHNAKLLGDKANIILNSIDSLSPEIKQNDLAELKNINFELTNRARRYVEKNPDKISSVVLIQDFFKNNTSSEVLDELLPLLKGDAANFFLTKDLKNYSETLKKSRVGALAPQIKLTNGKKTLDLASMRGRYVYLVFGTCDPDIYESLINDLAKAYALVSGNNTEFVSIFIDVPEEVKTPKVAKWQVFYDRDGWASESIKDYNVAEVPFGVLISPDGYILDRKIYAVDLPQKLTTFQKTKKPN